MTSIIDCNSSYGQHSGSVNLECWKQKNGRRAVICQLVGNQTLNSVTSYDSETSIEEYDSEEEADNEPIRAVLVPASQLAGQPFSLTVDQSGQVAAPSSLPLTMVVNFRSCYNKVKNVRQSLYTLGLDFW